MRKEKGMSTFMSPRKEKGMSTFMSPRLTCPDSTFGGIFERPKSSDICTHPLFFPPLKANEAAAWAGTEQAARQAFDFWNEFYDLRMGPNNDQPLDDLAKRRFILIVRAVSWVESQHGTGAGDSAKIDPIQAGNPNDSFWKTLTGQLGNGDRIIVGPGRGPNTNVWLKELPVAVNQYVQAKGLAIPGSSYDLNTLQNRPNGHNDANFNAGMSYFWGVGYLIHNINAKVSAAGRTYKCGDVSVDRLIDGAVRYNGIGQGAGDVNYRQKIIKAIDLFGGMP